MIHEAIFDTKMTRMGATAKEGRGKEEKRGEKYILTVTQREPDYPELI